MVKFTKFYSTLEILWPQKFLTLYGMLMITRKLNGVLYIRPLAICWNHVFHQKFSKNDMRAGHYHYPLYTLIFLKSKAKYTGSNNKCAWALMKVMVVKMCVAKTNLLANYMAADEKHDSNKMK